MLVSLLEDADPEVQASATGALMFATVKPQGERQRWFCGLLSGNPVLGNSVPKLLPSPPKPSVFDSVN